MNRQIFNTYVETPLAPTLQPGDVFPKVKRNRNLKSQSSFRSSVFRILP